jgi:spermidine synthase
MPPAIAAVIVFFASAAVLVLEILAGRLLAPYVGVSLETYTGIIGVVLAGISLGTWLGGRAADRTDPRTLLGPLLVAGGGLALLIVPIVSFVAALRPGSGPVSIVLFSLVAFFAPAAVLSAVSPTVVKSQLRDLAETGRVVGRYAAIGTAGAIVGTFATGFVLVAAFPSRPIVIALSLVLIVTGIVVWIRYGRGARNRTDVPLLAILLVLGAGSTAVAPQPCERETAYFCVRVEEDPARPTGRRLYLDTLLHSYVDLADPAHLEFGYTRIVGDVLAAAAPAGQAINAIHVGGGGFSIPRHLESVRPGSRSLVLELDEGILRTARDELGLMTSERLAVRVGDARLQLAGLPPAAYDVVVGDAFGGLAVPWHLTTREMVGEIRRVLRPGGMYVVNVIDYPPLGFARAQAATLREVFGNVGLMGAASLAAGASGGNVMLVASAAPLPADAITASNDARQGGDTLTTGEALDRWIGGATVLTDDYAPVDQLLSHR